MKILDFDGKTAVFFGDSITVGGFISASQRWATRITSARNGIEDNRGVSGSTMQSEVASYGCGRDHFHKENIPEKTDSYHSLWLAYNTNDILVNRAEMTPANFKAQLAVAVDFAIGSKGWVPEDIVILNGYWIPNLGASYGECGVTAARSRTNAEDFVEAANQLAVEKQLVLADLYNFTKNNPSYSTVDGLHPNEASHGLIAAFLENMDYTAQSPPPIIKYGRKFKIV